MLWSFTTRNSGSVPALVTVKDHRVVVTTDGISHTIPRAEIFGLNAVTIFMPQQALPIAGHLKDDGNHVRVADILSGRTTLHVSMEFSYKPTNEGFLGWLSDTYTYRSTWRFFHGPQYGFGMIEPAYAD
jgi:hypothetical protein